MGRGHGLLSEASYGRKETGAEQAEGALVPVPGRAGGLRAGGLGGLVTRGRRSKTEEGRETGLKAASLETRGGPRVELTGHPVPPWPVSPTRALPGAACGTASRLARAPAAASGGTAQGEVSGHLVSEPV